MIYHFAALSIAVTEKNPGKKARLASLSPVPGGNPGDTQLQVPLMS